MTIDEVKQGLKQIGPVVIHDDRAGFHVFRVQETEMGAQRHSCALVVQSDAFPHFDLSAELIDAGKQRFSEVRF